MIKFELQCKIKVDIDSILCLLILKDGRIGIGSNNSFIKIFKLNTFYSNLTIKEHKKGITSLTQTNKLKFNNIISTSKDSTIKIFEITDNSYKIIQIIEHYKKVNKFIELKNNIYDFCSCSDDGSLNLYNINKNKNKKEIIIKGFTFNYNDVIFNIIETNKNHIAVIFSLNYHCLKFIDIENKQVKKSIEQISMIGNNSICLFKYQYLVIGGSYMITIIDILKYSKTIIDINSWKIYSIINFYDNEKYILYSDDDGNIYTYELTLDNFSEINLIEKSYYKVSYSSSVFTVIFDKNNKKIITGGNNSTINIFNCFQQ